MRCLALALTVAAAGCITHLPPRTTTHLAIHWQAGWDAARAAAERAHKPLLVLLVAGEIAGPC